MASGDRFSSPTSRAQLEQSYRLAVGRQTIDLSGLVVSGDPLTLHADHRIGLLEIVVPDDATVDVTAEVRGGDIRLFGASRDGYTVDWSTVDGDDPTSRYVLDLEVGYGKIEVCRASQAVSRSGGLACTS